jgi:hypothetical protein
MNLLPHLQGLGRMMSIILLLKRNYRDWLSLHLSMMTDLPLLTPPRKVQAGHLSAYNVAVQAVTLPA